MLIAGMPYCPAKLGDPKGMDLGLASNLFFEYCLHEEDWGAIVDHDLAVLTPGWRGEAERAIEEYPDAGIFTVKLNKAPPGSRWQLAQGVSSEEHDLRQHLQIAMRETKCTPRAVDVTHPDQIFKGAYLLSGFMIIRKDVWRRAGKFPSGFKFVDWGMHRRVADIGLKVYLLNRVYAYHWGRGKKYPSA